MDSTRDDSSSDGWRISMDANNSKDKKSYHRHTNHQIYRLEA